MRIPQKIDTYLDGHTRVTTNVCARLYWTEVLEAFITEYSSINLVRERHRQQINSAISDVTSMIRIVLADTQ